MVLWFMSFDALPTYHPELFDMINVDFGDVEYG